MPQRMFGSEMPFECPTNDNWRGLITWLLILPNYPQHADGMKVSLKTSHVYFTQVQCQIFLGDIKYCDFVLWIKREMFAEYITRPKDIWVNASSKALDFFKAAALPELVCWYLTNAHTSLSAKIATGYRLTCINNKQQFKSDSRNTCHQRKPASIPSQNRGWRTAREHPDCIHVRTHSHQENTKRTVVLSRLQEAAPVLTLSSPSSCTED